MDEVIATFQAKILEQANKQRAELDQLFVLLQKNINEKTSMTNEVASITLDDIYRGVSTLVDEKASLSRKYAFLGKQHRNVLSDNAWLRAQNAKLNDVLKSYLIKYQPNIPLVPIRQEGHVELQHDDQHRENGQNDDAMSIVLLDSDSDDDDGDVETSNCNRSTVQVLHPVELLLNEGPHQTSDQQQHQDQEPHSTQIIEVSEADTKLYVCSEINCNAIFTQKNRFNYHMKSHRSGASSTDQAVQKKIRSVATNRRSIKNGKTPAKTDKKSTDAGTKRGRKSVRNVKGSPLKKQPFVCNISGCGKQFPKSLSLKRHSLRHPENAKYFCSINGCDRRYGYKVDFDRHLATHNY